MTVYSHTVHVNVFQHCHMTSSSCMFNSAHGIQLSVKFALLPQHSTQYIYYIEHECLLCAVCAFSVCMLLQLHLPKTHTAYCSPQCNAFNLTYHFQCGEWTRLMRFKIGKKKSKYLLYSLICNIPVIQCKNFICNLATVPGLNGEVNSDIINM